MKGFHRQDTKVAEGGREEEEVPRERIEPSGELDELAHRVIGAAIEVHRHLGPGFLEGVYEEALGIEFRIRAIPAERQKIIAIGYKGPPVGEAGSTSSSAAA